MSFKTSTISQLENLTQQKSECKPTNAIHTREINVTCNA